MKLLPAAILGVLLSGAVAAQDDRALGSIEGIVRERDGGAAIGRAQVELRAVRSPGDRRVGDFKAVTTGADGRFAFRDVAPGEYRLYATRSTGYVPGEYGQRTATGEGTSFTLRAGQTMSSVSLLMTPTASISGRVVDADGEPSGYAHVQALKAVYRNGHRVLTVMQLVQADERGQYRLFWLPPGDYYVAAKPLDLRRSSEMMHIPPPSRFQTYEQQMRPTVTAVNTSRFDEDGTRIEEQYVPTYYPGTTDERSASTLRVTAGQNLSGIELNVGGSLVRTRRIRGIAFDGTTGQPTVASLQVISRDSPSILLIPTGSTGQDGTFDLWGALPGSNYVVASGRGGSALVPVDITGTDVNGVTLTLRPPVRIRGRITLADTSGADAIVRGISVSLRRDPPVNGLQESALRFTTQQTGPDGRAMTVERRVIGGPGPSSDESGMFILDGVSPGVFAVVVGTGRDEYVESIRLGSRDVLTEGLHVDGRAIDDELAIVIDTRGGRVEGVVIDDRRPVGPGVTVVAVPDDARSRHDLHKVTVTGSEGAFSLGGLAPGSYEIFAWSDVESGAWHDPEFRRREQGRGRHVRISEGTRIKTDVPMIASQR